MRLRWHLTAAAMAATLATACGDGLLDDAYRGEPRFSYAGQMATGGGEPLYQNPLRAGIFWLPYDPTALAVEDSEATLIDAAGFARLGLPPDAALVEQSSIEVAVAFPGYFAINVFADPPPEAYAADNGLSYGVVLIYEDRNRSGAFDEGELAGGGPSQMVYFARRALADDDPAHRLDRAVTPGYGLIELPLRCGAPLPTFEPHPDFDVRVGAACTDDAACGTEGECLRGDFDGVLPGGYCVLPEAALAEACAETCAADCAASCAAECAEDQSPACLDPCADTCAPACAVDCEEDGPAGMTLVESEKAGIELKAWYQACGSSAECREGYTCQQDICLPDLQSSLLLDREVEIEGTCAIEHEVERRQPGGG